jgi:hypothetical protein
VVHCWPSSEKFSFLSSRFCSEFCSKHFSLQNFARKSLGIQHHYFSFWLREQLIGTLSFERAQNIKIIVITKNQIYLIATFVLLWPVIVLSAANNKKKYFFVCTTLKEWYKTSSAKVKEGK